MSEFVLLPLEEETVQIFRRGEQEWMPTQIHLLLSRQTYQAVRGFWSLG